MTIHELITAAGLTANDEIPIWDAEASGEPTKKITGTTLAAAIKTLASLIATSDLDNTPTSGSNNAVKSGGVYTAIEQTTAYETITDFDTFKPTNASTVSRRYGSCTGGTALHAPVSGNSETFRGYVEGGPNYFTQHFTTEYTNIAYKNGREFVRVCLNGTFSPWQELRASLPLATVAANGGTLDIKIGNYTMLKLTVTSYRTDDMGVALITTGTNAAAVKWLGTSPSYISLSGYSGSAITLTNNDANNNVYVLVEPIYGRAVSF